MLPDVPLCRLWIKGPDPTPDAGGFKDNCYRLMFDYMKFVLTSLLSLLPSAGNFKLDTRYQCNARAVHINAKGSEIGTGIFHPLEMLVWGGPSHWWLGDSFDLDCFKLFARYQLCTLTAEN